MRRAGSSHPRGARSDVLSASRHLPPFDSNFATSVSGHFKLVGGPVVNGGIAHASISVRGRDGQTLQYGKWAHLRCAAISNCGGSFCLLKITAASRVIQIKHISIDLAEKPGGDGNYSQRARSAPVVSRGRPASTAIPSPLLAVEELDPAPSDNKNPRVRRVAGR